MASEFKIRAKVQLDLNDIQSQLDSIKGKTIHLNADTQGFELSLSVANALMRECIGLIDSMVEEVYDLDKAIVEFKKVSELRDSGLEDYVDTLSELGQVTARTASEMVEAATMFRKSGFTDAESSELAVMAT